MTGASLPILDAAARVFLEWLGRASFQATVLAILVLVMQWILGERLSARWRCGLWLLVVLRLLMPAAPQTRFSPFNLFNLPRNRSVSVVEPNFDAPTPAPAETRQPIAADHSSDTHTFEPLAPSQPAPDFSHVTSA